MAILNKDGILNASDLKRETVSVPEWGGEVYVSEMGALTLIDFYAAVFPEDDDEQKDTHKLYVPTAVAFCVVDEAGEPLFTAADVKRLARKSNKALKRVFDVADRLNLLTAKAREDTGKNSCSGEDGGASCLSSPAISASQASGTSAES